MTGEVGGETTRPQLEALLALQDLDVRLQQLTHRRANLPERAPLAEVEAGLARLDGEMATLEGERSRLVGQRDSLDAEAGAATARINAIEERLRSGAAGSYRDQEAMSAEVASLDRRRREIEDHELEVMEELEPLEATLASLAGERASRESDRELAATGLRQALADADAVLAEVAAGRPALVGQVDPGLLSTYESLAARLGGVAVARVVHGTCDGCRLALSASELDRLRHAGPSLARCEQCGRILVP